MDYFVAISIYYIKNSVLQNLNYFYITQHTLLHLQILNADFIGSLSKFICFLIQGSSFSIL